MEREQAVATAMATVWNLGVAGLHRVEAPGGLSGKWGLAPRLVPLALVLVLSSFSGDAKADCDTVGSTVTCTGTTPGGFQAGVDGLSVDVVGGVDRATVGAQDLPVAISVDADSSVTNNGTVQAAGVGLQAGADSTLTNTSTGLIEIFGVED